MENVPSSTPRGGETTEPQERIFSTDEGLSHAAFLRMAGIPKSRGEDDYHPTETRLRYAERDLNTLCEMADRADRDPNTWWD